jgi:hypothetical protein
VVPRPVPVFIPVVVPRHHVIVVPVVQTIVLPALGQVLAGEPIPPVGPWPGPEPFPPVGPWSGPEPFLAGDAFQDVPLQIVPLEPDLLALVHPLLFCEVGVADACEALADQLAEIAPGFGTSTTDGPNGYGVYLTYQSSDAALDDMVAAAPTQEVVDEAEGTMMVQLVLFCDDDATGACGGLAEELADVRPGFGTMTMDGPQGYGVYLTYQGDTDRSDHWYP